MKNQFLEELYVTLTILDAPSDILSSIASINKVITEEEATEDLKRWNQIQLRQWKEIVKTFLKHVPE